MMIILLLVLINGCILAYVLSKSDYTHDKPVHCSWSDFGQCTKTCDQGFRYRHHIQNAKHNGNECTGGSFEPCYLAECPDPGIYQIIFIF